MPPRRTHLAAVLAGAAFAAGLATGALGSRLSANPGERMAFATLAIQIFLGLGTVAVALLSPLPLRRRLGLEPGRLSRRQLALAAFGTLALSHALDTLLGVTGLRDRSALIEVDALLAGAGPRTLVLALLALGVAPGLAEELLCRGWLQRGLVARLGPASGIVLASLGFGALHLEWIQGSAAAVLGLYLGALAYRAGSTRPAILCHVANNVTAVVLASSGLSRLELDGEGSAAALLGLAGGALALSGAALWRVWRLAPAPASPDPRIGLQAGVGSDDG